MMRIQKAEIKKKLNIQTKKLEKLKESPSHSNQYTKDTLSSLRSRVAKLEHERKRHKETI